MTYRHRVATVFCSAFFLDFDQYVCSPASPFRQSAAVRRFPSRNWRGSECLYSRSSDGRCAVQRLAQRIAGAKTAVLLSLGLSASARWRQDLPTAWQTNFWRCAAGGWAAGCNPPRPGRWRGCCFSRMSGQSCRRRLLVGLLAPPARRR